jgi:catechol 2,3-dioxygenase-like lactoylglutathione lyase family enzyme
MATVQEQPPTTPDASPALAVDLKLEAVVIPVADIDRAKAFYAALGWRLDADMASGNFRVIQYTPPGSSASILFGRGVTAAAPGSAQGLYLVVSDIEAARAELLRRGAEVSEAFHYGRGDGPSRVRLSGPDPKRPSYGTYASFTDPDGNLWLLQQVTSRLPGRIDTGIARFTSPSDLAGALRRAAAAHGEHEAKAGGAYDEKWPDWYAAYLVAEQAGTPLPD